MSSENLATAHMISFRGNNTPISNVCIQGKMHIIFFTCLEYVPQIINALIITSRFFISSMPRQWPCNVCFFLVITPINFIFKLLSLVTSRNDVSCLAIPSHVLSFHIARFYANPRGCHTNIYLYRISTRDQPIFHSSLHLSRLSGAKWMLKNTESLYENEFFGTHYCYRNTGMPVSTESLSTAFISVFT